MAKKKKQKDSTEKLNMANKAASKGPQFKSTYNSVENALMYFLRSISGLIEKIIQSNRLSLVFALLISILLFVVVNSSDSALGVTQSTTLTDIPVSIVYNSEVYEISGIPDSVDVIVQGDMSDITLQKSTTSSYVLADLSGLTEGTYTIKLEATNFNSNLIVNVLDTPSVTVTIKKKVTEKFNISYEFINKNSMDSTYSLSEPVFDSTEVLIRASQDTIDSIAFVKALIDVTGVSETFTTSAEVVAYDNDGNIVDCDIIPETVSATVEVSSPSKTVPITVKAVGEIADGYSIDSINLDYESVTLYAAQETLDLIEEIVVEVDVSGISTNTVYSTTLTTPSGVTSMSVTRVNMEINVGETVSREIEGVRVSWANYSSEYMFMIVNSEDATMTVTVSGTASNIESITADDISVVIDLSDVTIGTQQAPLIVSGTNENVTYEITNGKQYVEVEITEAE